MLVLAPDVLSADEVASMRSPLDTLAWESNLSLEGQAIREHLHLPETHPLASACSNAVLRNLLRHPLVVAAALPRRVTPPRFSRCTGRSDFGVTVGTATLSGNVLESRVRSDLCVLLSLSSPQDYDGGEITVEDTYGTHTVKPAAGQAMLFPANAYHRVAPVTRGACISVRCWIQSLVRDGAKRDMLLELDNAIQQLSRDVPNHRSTVPLTGVYHNLLRTWAEV